MDNRAVSRTATPSGPRQGPAKCLRYPKPCTEVSLKGWAPREHGKWKKGLKKSLSKEKNPNFQHWSNQSPVGLFVPAAGFPLAALLVFTGLQGGGCPVEQTQHSLGVPSPGPGRSLNPTQEPQVAERRRSRDRRG